MKRIFVILSAMFAALGITLSAADIRPLEKQKWGHVCRGSMPAEWYGSDEARAIADNVVAVQKDNGGWMKNDQLHRLSDKQREELIAKRREHSCLDNYATTQEMRFLARVWKATGEPAYQASFVRGLEMILACQKGCGGWSQYWPLTGKGSYQDYITFNDDLMTNIMLILRDVYEGKGFFEGIADEVMQARCRTAFDRGLECILACQIPDGKTRSVWCAQHDTVAPYYATEGRPHELPSYSGSESATLLSFLMSIENPSKEVQASIRAAVSWLDAHKMDGLAVEDFTNVRGEEDRRIVSREGTALWPRFIQIGGKVAKPTYDLFFRHLEERNKKRFQWHNNMRYSFHEVDNARASYDPKRAYDPIYGIYKDSLQNLYYRFLYHYEDTPPVADKDGVPVKTSLLPVNRAKYQYVGDWPWEVIYGEYLPWRQAVEAKTPKGAEWLQVDRDLTMTNAKGKDYGHARIGTIKLNPIEYRIQLPEGKKAKRVYIFGYANGEQECSVECVKCKVVFPAKGYHPAYVEQTIDLGEGIAGELPLTIEGGQVCVIIRVLTE